MSDDNQDEIQALRAALKQALAERDALAVRAVTDREWAHIEHERVANKRRLCPHLSIEAGSNRCLACGGTWNGNEGYKPPEK